MQKIHRSFIYLLISLAVICFFPGCAGITSDIVSSASYSHSNATEKKYRITVLHTNDHHGRFWRNEKGEYGMAARKTVINRVRAEVESQGGFVLLLDAGDVNTGIPESKMLNAEPDIRGMNLLGYDAMVVGNHEFDNPLSVLMAQRSWMKFPLLCANVYDKTTGEPLFEPFSIFEFKGLQILVLGLITADTVRQANPDNITPLKFADPIEACRDMMPQLKEKADVIIALTHLGYHPHGKHGGNARGSVSLARAVHGIDVIVDGHTHTRLEKPDVQNNTIIVQAGEYGKYLGRLDLEYSDGHLTQKDYRLIPVNLKKKIKKGGQSVEVIIGEEIEEDPEVLALLSEYQEGGAEKLKTIIGSSNGRFTGDRDIIRRSETDLGNLVCRALMAETGADVSLMNAGGIRADLPSGNITYKDVLKVCPFGNTICTVKLTGKELTNYLHAAVRMEKNTGGFAQISGAVITVSKNKIIRVLLKEKIVSDFGIYTLALPRYVASGGDGYPKLTDHPGFLDTGFVDADVLKTFISEHSPLDINEFQPEHNVVLY